MSLQQLMQQGHIWRGTHSRQQTCRGLSSGYPELDNQLLGQGWPSGALIEILHAGPGCGELQLLQPLLAQRPAHSWLLWVNPPAVPYAPALQQWQWRTERQLWLTETDHEAALWAAEQSLRSGCCVHVLAWLEYGRYSLPTTALRRLQLAAEQGQAQCWLFRHPQQLAQRSPAAVRAEVGLASHGLTVTLHKRRGRWPLAPLTLSTPAGTAL